MKQTILIVDDEKEIRELLRLYIEKDGYCVVQAENGLEALKQADTAHIDLAVIDIMMPKLNGYQLIKALRERGSIPIIIISAKTENHEKILGLDLGADDYVTKPFDPLEVMARIRARLRRQDSLASVLLSAGVLTLDTSACTLSFGKQNIPLTATEFNMMKLFMQSPGRVFTRQQIYNAAWQEPACVDDNTVMVPSASCAANCRKTAGYPSELSGDWDIGWRFAHEAQAQYTPDSCNKVHWLLLWY